MCVDAPRRGLGRSAAQIRDEWQTLGGSGLPAVYPGGKGEEGREEGSGESLGRVISPHPPATHHKELTAADLRVDNCLCVVRRLVGRERSCCLSRTMNITRVSPRAILRYVKRTRTKERERVGSCRTTGRKVFAPVVTGGGRQLGVAGEAVDHTVKCFLTRLRLLLTVVTSGQRKQSARGVGTKYHAETHDDAVTRQTKLSLADQGQRDAAEGLTVIASHISHCLAHRQHHLALVSHREECHRGGCGGQGRVTLPSRHASAAPEADRQVGGAAGHPLTDGTLLSLPLSKAPHLTSLSPRQGREWPVQHFSSRFTLQPFLLATGILLHHSQSHLNFTFN